MKKDEIRNVPFPSQKQIVDKEESVAKRGAAGYLIERQMKMKKQEVKK